MLWKNDILGNSLWNKDVANTLNYASHIYRFFGKRKNPITKLSQVKQVLNKGLQQLKLAHHDGAVVYALGDILLVDHTCIQLGQDSLYEKDDCRDRCPHLVTYRRCERLCLSLRLMFFL